MAIKTQNYVKHLFSVVKTVQFLTNLFINKHGPRMALLTT